MLEDKAKNIYVLDTNVVLYDYRCIFSFDHQIVVIPITLLEELDNFKKGNEIINFNAREFTRVLDGLIGNQLLNEGVELDHGGFVMVDTNIKQDKFLKEVFWEDKPDHRILSVAYNLAKKYGKTRVKLVSKDINLRMKAKSIGIYSQDYETGKIKNIDELYTGKNLLENVKDEIIDNLFQNEQVGIADLNLDSQPFPHEYFILRNIRKSILATFCQETQALQVVWKKSASAIQPRNAEQMFSLDALMNPEILLVTLAGKAGTGKTLMALAASLEMRNNYHQILLARPIIPLANKDIGYLPGSIKRKIDPYMQPLFDNLSVIQNQFGEGTREFKQYSELIDEGKLVITPLAFIRGRTLPRVYFIVDEAQNLTPHEVKTIITRAGEGTKIVFTGDPYQIDTPYLDSRSNGLTYLIDQMKGQPVYAHITLEKGERSPLAELASNLL